MRKEMTVTYMAQYCDVCGKEMDESKPLPDLGTEVVIMQERECYHAFEVLDMCDNCREELCHIISEFFIHKLASKKQPEEDSTEV